MPHKSKICWKHSFRKFFLRGHFWWSVATNRWGRVLIFPLLRGKVLEVCLFVCFPCLKLNSIYFLKFTCPQCCSVFWNLLSTVDVIHTASCSTTQLLSSLSEVECVSLLRSVLLPSNLIVLAPGRTLGKRDFFPARSSFLLCDSLVCEYSVRWGPFLQ